MFYDEEKWARKWLERTAFWEAVKELVRIGKELETDDPSVVFRSEWTIPGVMETVCGNLPWSWVEGAVDRALEGDEDVWLGDEFYIDVSNESFEFFEQRRIIYPKKPVSEIGKQFGSYLENLGSR